MTNNKIFMAFLGLLLSISPRLQASGYWADDFYKQAYNFSEKSGSYQWYYDNFTKDTQTLVQLYHITPKEQQRAELLRIATAFNNLREELNDKNKMEFCIKVDYWSCKLSLLKKQLGSLGTPFACSADRYFSQYARDYYWQTDYPFHLEKTKALQIAHIWCRHIKKTALSGNLGLIIQYYLTSPPLTSHADFDRYLQLFQAGIVHYNVTSSKKCAHLYYQKHIEQSIQELKNVYPQLRTQALQEAAVNITCKLVQSYKIQGFDFFYQYITCQKQFIDLKKSAGIKDENDIHANKLDLQ